MVPANAGVSLAANFSASKVSVHQVVYAEELVGAVAVRVLRAVSQKAMDFGRMGGGRQRKISADVGVHAHGNENARPFLRLLGPSQKVRKGCWAR